MSIPLSRDSSSLSSGPDTQSDIISSYRMLVGSALWSCSLSHCLLCLVAKSTKSKSELTLTLVSGTKRIKRGDQ
jgi:hypothetical protein